MGRGQEDKNGPREDAGRGATNTAREVVTDILAEALWTLICNGHGPSAPASQQPGMTSLSNAAVQRARVRQPVENARN